MRMLASGHFQVVPFQCCKISPFRSHPAAQALPAEAAVTPSGWAELAGGWAERQRYPGLRATPPHRAAASADSAVRVRGCLVPPTVPAPGGPARRSFTGPGQTITIAWASL